MDRTCADWEWPLRSKFNCEFAPYLLPYIKNTSGIMKNASASSMPVNNETNTNIVSIKPGAGVWIAFGNVNFGTNGDGRRAIKLSLTPEDSGNPNSTQVFLPVGNAGGSLGRERISTSMVFKTNDDDTIYLIGYQNSGSTINCSGIIDLVRIDAQFGTGYIDNEYEPEEKRMKIYMYDTSGTNNYTATLVVGGAHAVLFDTTDNVNLSSWIRSQRVTHLDALIITHFHSDHYNVNSLVNLIESGLIDKETKIYIQMEPTSTHDQYSVYSTHKASLLSTLNLYELNDPIVPYNKSTESFGDLVCTFYNTNTSYKTTYDNSWANDGNFNHTNSLNNYSLVTRCEYGNSSYLETGDIEGAAQILLCDDMQPVDVCKHPHHFANKMGWEKFYEKVNPKIWLVSSHINNTVVDELTRLDMGVWRASYLYRYYVYKSITTPIITNLDNGVYIELVDGNVKRADGHYIDKDYDPYDYLSYYMSMTGFLPPDIYYDDPYHLYGDDFTVEEFINIFKHFDYANTPTSWYIPVPSQSDGSYTNSPVTSYNTFSRTLREMFKEFGEFGSINPYSKTIAISKDEFGRPKLTMSKDNDEHYLTITLWSATGNTITGAYLTNPTTSVIANSNNPFSL